MRHAKWLQFLSVMTALVLLLGVAPAVSPARPADAAGLGIIYAVAANDDLLWYRHDGRTDGTFTWASNTGKKVGNGWAFRQVFSGGNGVIYAITFSGDLLWYFHNGRTDGTFDWADNNGRKVGVGWNFKQVFSGGGGDGVIYAITDSGDLLWYRHDGQTDGTFRWASGSGNKVGVGWNFKQVFSGGGGNGVIYGVTSSGDLLWYRHDGRTDGTFRWADNNGRKVGVGWNFRQVFSGGGGDGVIYGIADNYDLLWYRHDGRSDGTFKWADNNGRKVGTGWNFKQVFAD